MTRPARIAALVLAGLVSACQSTGGKDGGTPAAIEPLESVARTETPSPAPAPDPLPSAPAGPAAEPAPATAPATATARRASSNDRVLAAVEAIARLRKTKGHQAAMAQVLACYNRASAPSVPVEASKVCAAQDFVISRALEDENGGPGRGSPQLIIAGRAPERIGALMQAKGMSQQAFNTFGLYLNSVALPAFRKASA